ncbi:sensor histidine kinase [Streptomyces avicenniae]|uniref:sensor histidine kinase n=1 Tax=Streptomyces avicenniae TaxID=500153 RepID=UPI000DA63981|nr:histidine kinase [Streptomyces avicenniae]
MTDTPTARAEGQRTWMLPSALLAAETCGTGDRVRRTGRDWLVDLTLFAWAVGLWCALLPSLPDLDYLPDWMVTLDAPLGALACVGLWWRRRHPLALAIALIPIGALSTTVFGALAVVILNLGLRVPRRTAWAVLALHVALGLPYGILAAGEDTGDWAAAFFFIAYYLFFYAWGAALRARRQLVTRLRDDAQRERAEHARRLADVRRAEREAIAREMHDVLAHRISLLSVHAGALAYRTAKQQESRDVPALTDAEISDSAQLIRDTAHQALEELRDVLTVLRGSARGAEGPQPGIGDLPDLLADAERAGQRITLVRDDATDTPDAADQLRGPVQRTVYRVVQEGLTNARKHAPGAPVTVTFSGAPGRGLTVALRNGLTDDADRPIPGAGAGLTGLEERVALDGGTLRHGAAQGTFTLVAELPWPGAAARPGAGEGDGTAAAPGADRTGTAAAQPQLPPH